MALSLCGTAGVANLGELRCDKAKGVAKKFFIWNGSMSSASYPDENTAWTNLLSYAKLSKSAANKLLPLPEVQEIADNSEADKEGTLGLGFSVRLVAGRPKYTVKFFAGADLLKRLRTYDNTTVGFLEYDANGILWGTESNSTFRGYQAKFTFSGGRLATGQNVEEGVVTCTISVLSNSEYIDNSKYLQIDENIEDLVGLIDAPLAYVSKASNVYKYSLSIRGTSLVSPYDVLPDYGTIIAGLLASFSAKSAASAALAPTGAALAISSIAYNVGSDGLLTVTYDPTAFAAAGAFITLIPPTPTQLDTGTVTNLEILPVTHAK